MKRNDHEGEGEERGREVGHGIRNTSWPAAGY